MHPTHKQAERLSSAQILRDAAAYLDWYGWVQGVLYTPSGRTSMPAACASGAIRAVVTGRPLHTLEDCDDEDQVYAIIAAETDFAEWLMATDAASGEQLPVIAWWNDTPTTTGQDVIDALRAAADADTRIRTNLHPTTEVATVDGAP